MSGQPITLTLSRADFDWLRQVATLALAYGPGDPVGEDRVHRIRAAVEAALNAAPAEGPERAATGETLPFTLIENTNIPFGWLVGADDQKIVVNRGGDQIEIPWSKVREALRTAGEETR